MEREFCRTIETQEISDNEKENTMVNSKKFKKR